MSILEMFPECLEAFKKISAIGEAKGYSPDSWKGESAERHIGKAIGHLGRWLVVIDEAGDFRAKGFSEDHLLHAMWRICAAVALIEPWHISQEEPL